MKTELLRKANLNVTEEKKLLKLNALLPKNCFVGVCACVLFPVILQVQHM